VSTKPKLLLTSAGITNPSLRRTLVEMLGKPIEESVALCVPTASYGHPSVSPHQAWVFISGQEPRTPMVELGWKSVGILELTAMPSMAHDRWKDWLREADVLLVNGGEPTYLSHWMRKSGLAAFLPSWGADKVYLGLSAGSIVMSPRLGEDFMSWRPPRGSGDKGLGMVDFAMFPHLDHPDLPENRLADALKWAAGMTPIPCYGIDDQTGIRVVNGKMDVVSEGHWKLLEPAG